VIKNLIESFYVFEAWKGISADEEAEWKRYGFTRLSDVLKWRGYFDPKDAAEWRNAGFRDGREAREWYKALGVEEKISVKPWEAKAWRNLGFDLETAAAWNKAGFSPSRAKEWISLGVSKTTATALEKKGMTPEMYKLGIQPSKEEKPVEVYAKDRHEEEFVKILEDYENVIHNYVKNIENMWAKLDPVDRNLREIAKRIKDIQHKIGLPQINREQLLKEIDDLLEDGLIKLSEADNDLSVAQDHIDRAYSWWGKYYKRISDLYSRLSIKSEFIKHRPGIVPTPLEGRTIDEIVSDMTGAVKSIEGLFDTLLHNRRVVDKLLEQAIVFPDSFKVFGQVVSDALTVVSDFYRHINGYRRRVVRIRELLHRLI
jgi:hypothetical protein